MGLAGVRICAGRHETDTAADMLLRDSITTEELLGQLESRRRAPHSTRTHKCRYRALRNRHYRAVRQHDRAGEWVVFELLSRHIPLPARLAEDVRALRERR